MAKPDRTSSAEQTVLSASEHQFVLEYVANGFNATSAYRAAHPRTTYATARMEGSKTLAKPYIRAFIDQRLADRWKALQMDGDEALGRVARDARADIRMLFDEDGRLRKPCDWPEEVAGSIRSVRLGRNGMTITLVDTLKARLVISEQTGRLKHIAGNTFDALAAALRLDIEHHR